MATAEINQLKEKVWALLTAYKWTGQMERLNIETKISSLDFLSYHNI